VEKKVYQNKGEKVIDFLIGFFLIPGILSITIWCASIAVGYRNFGRFIPALVLLPELAGAIYLCLKRKYMGIGWLFALVVVPLVLLGTCLLIMGLSLFRR